MKLYSSLLILIASVMALTMNSCQKLDRPEMGEIIYDPEPPPYNPLKSFWAFENNLEDQGENDLTATSVRVSYVPGVTGQALRIDSAGYVLLRGVGDTVRQANGFMSLPIDTLTNLGSFTLAFWMNGAGPVQGGAQGVFSMSHKSEFWGNLDLFLENWSNPADPAEAFLKIHMFNSNVSSGNGEQWIEVKIPNALNKWTHLAITYNAANSQMSIYADGQPTAVNNRVLSNGNYGKVSFSNFNGMVLGNFHFQTTPTLTNHGPEDWARSFKGSFDQFRIYNRGLSADEVNALFTAKN